MSLEYVKSQLIETEIPRLYFTKNWESSADFPQYEPSEMQVRKDMQYLHDEAKNYINEELIPAVNDTFENVAELFDNVDSEVDRLDADIADRATHEELKTKLQETILGQIEDGTITEEKLSQELLDRSYTREETVSVETKTAFGLAEDATPDAVLQAIDPQLDKVGDIKVTLRKLDDKWLLCNGKAIDHYAYPDLKKLLTLSFASSFVDEADSGSYDWTVHSVCEHDGVWVATTYRGSYYSRLFVTRDPYGEWTPLEFNTSQFAVYSITYQNGMWVGAGGSYYAGGSGQTYQIRPGFFYNTGDPFDLSAWKWGRISTDTQSTSDLFYYDGKWVAVGSSAIFVATDWALGWTKVASKSYTECVRCYNGVWVIGGYDSSSKNACIWTTTDPVNGTWEMKILDTMDEAEIHDIQFFDGVYYAVGGSTSSNGLGRRIYSATDILGDWVKVYGDDSANGNSDGCYYQIRKDGDTFVLRGSKGVFLTSDLTAEPTQVYSSVPAVLRYNGETLLLTTTGVTIGSTSRKRFAVLRETFLRPTITHDGAKTYIKAKM